jgi:PAS domain S-box-containing protein
MRHLRATTRPAGADRHTRVATLSTSAERRLSAVEDETLYRLIVEGAIDYAILTTDPDGRVASWSPGAEAVFGWTAAEIIGQPGEVMFLPEDRARGEHEREMRTALRDGWAPDVRWHLTRSGGKVFIEGHTRSILGRDGALRGFVKIGQDATVRRGLDQALRESEERFRTLAELSPDGILVVVDGRVVYANRSAVRLLAAPDPPALLGADPLVFLEPELRSMARRQARQVLTRQVPAPPVETVWRRLDGGRVTLEVSAAATLWNGRRAVQALLRDVEERKRAEAALAVARDELERARVEPALLARQRAELALENELLATQVAERRALEESRDELARRVAAAEDQERKHLSRELHDQMGQLVTALILGLRQLEATVGLVPGLEDLQGLAEQIAREIHDIAAALRPPGLDRLGLHHALESHLDEWSARYGVSVDFHSLGVERERFDPETETAVFRAVQEGLSNVAKHADASTVSLLLERHREHLAVVLEDDGVGFDVAGGTEGVGGGRLGLLGMHERVRLLGGTVEIESAPGQGTALYLRIPVQRDGLRREL